MGREILNSKESQVTVNKWWITQVRKWTNDKMRSLQVFVFLKLHKYKTFNYSQIPECFQPCSLVLYLIWFQWFSCWFTIYPSFLFPSLQLTKCNCQIINLGAGFDTTYWNLKDEGLAPLNFVEIDFQGITNRKAYYIKNRKPLLDKLQSEGEWAWAPGRRLSPWQTFVMW